MAKNALMPIRYEEKWSTVMANDIVHGRQEMTLQEARIIRLVITQVAKEDNDLKTYTCNIKELAAFLGISPNNIYRDIFNICESLMRRIVYIGTGNPKNPWQMYSWISYANYDRQGTVTLRLSEDIRRFVLDLSDYFTQYKLENIIQMDSFYALRLYELIKSDDYKDQEFLEYSVDYLRAFFDCEKKYERIIDLKKNVINVSVKEINAKTDVFISKVDYGKEGRKITSIRFYVHENEPILKKREKERQLIGQISLDGSEVGEGASAETTRIKKTENGEASNG